jgi:hypothetical protein
MTDKRVVMTEHEFAALGYAIDDDLQIARVH